MPETVFEGVIPIFRVHSVADSVDYYVDVLGFKLNWKQPAFASVARDRCEIFLCEGDQGHPGTWVWIGVPDVQSLFEDYRSKAAKVRHPPTNYAWALEMQVEDLDGNILRIGSEAKKDQPIGEWFDMHGNRWAKSPGHAWVRVEHD